MNTIRKKTFSVGLLGIATLKPQTQNLN
jgi:hypothetical protein